MGVETLQWGGRFSAAPDADLLQFGSSLSEDLVLAAFDVQCSQAHVTALEQGGVISTAIAASLKQALFQVWDEIASGAFAIFAQSCAAEDIHGAIDQRVRTLCAGDSGEWLHAGRSRNDQVATTLLLYVRDRARMAKETCLALASHLLERASAELSARSALSAITHWQPAQPILLAYWLEAVAEMIVRSASRFAAVQKSARQACPLGSAAVCGSTLPLDRSASANELGFAAPSRNAMDAIGTRDVALDLLHGFSRALSDTARVCTELIMWATPAYGYIRLDDAASTGSSLMPQKRNPDPFELVRAAAAVLNGSYSAAVASVSGIPLSYHRDLQETKALVLAGSEKGLGALRAFARAFKHIHFLTDKMAANAQTGFTIATDVADSLVRDGLSPKRAHATVGEMVLHAEKSGAENLKGIGDVALDARGSIEAKQTIGSTNPAQVAAAIAALRSEIEALS
ncbi:MAG: argininosuccinate lyase [Candidatus Eremiobacteraeota bacterium]|nr:argininosuccinate lyase [Candidatus Eremiobacteraeota bacterium]